MPGRYAPVDQSIIPPLEHGVRTSTTQVRPHMPCNQPPYSNADHMSLHDCQRTFLFQKKLGLPPSACHPRTMQKDEDAHCRLKHRKRRRLQQRGGQRRRAWPRSCHQGLLTTARGMRRGLAQSGASLQRPTPAEGRLSRWAGMRLGRASWRTRCAVHAMSALRDLAFSCSTLGSACSDYYDNQACMPCPLHVVTLAPMQWVIWLKK